MIVQGVPTFAASLTGENLSQAVQQDFFQWFHFTEKERKQEPHNETMVLFTTGMHGFDVELGVKLDKNQSINSLVLAMPRDFVDDPQYGSFARDIAKSFLLSAVADADKDSIKPLANQIAFAGADLHKTGKVNVVNDATGEKSDNTILLKSGNGELKKGDAAWLGVGAVPKLPADSTKGFLVYSGKQQIDEETFSKSRLKIENTNAGKGKPMITFMIAPNAQ